LAGIIIRRAQRHPISAADTLPQERDFVGADPDPLGANRARQLAWLGVIALGAYVLGDRLPSKAFVAALLGLSLTD
jgi:hypothetical protein